MRRLVLVSLLTLLAASTAASATPALRRVDSMVSGSPVMADRHGLLAYRTAPGQVRVIDAQLREVARIDDPPNCEWTGFGAGQLLWDCGNPEARWSRTGALIDVRTRRVTGLGGAPGPMYEEADWTDVGRSWIEERLRSDHGEPTTQFVSRRDGEVRTTQSLVDRTLVADLDAPGLWRRVCAPLHAGTTEEGPYGEPPARAAYAYDRPLGAGSDYHDGHARLLWGHCGRPQRVLSRCLVSCAFPIVGDHVILWWEAAYASYPIKLLLTDRGTVWSWPEDQPRRVALAGRRLFVATPTALLTVRLPPVHRR